MVAVLETNKPRQLNSPEQYAARITQALTILATEFGLKDNQRVTIQVLHGLAGGRKRFQASYETIRRQLKEADRSTDFANEGNGEEESNRNQEIRRRLKRIDARQKELGITLMEWTPGGMNPDGTHWSTEFCLPIIDMAEEVYTMAQRRPDFRKNPGKATEAAAREKAREVLRNATPTSTKKTAQSLIDLRKMAEKKLDRLPGQVKQYMDQGIKLLTEASATEEEIYHEIDQAFDRLDAIRWSLLESRRLQTEAKIIKNEGEVKEETQGGGISSSLPLQFCSGSERIIGSSLGDETGVDPLQKCTGVSDLQPVKQAELMIDAFVSVGQTAFDLTLTTENKKLQGHTPKMTAPALIEELPRLMKTTEAAPLNLIIRPRPADESAPFVVQLDDLGISAVDRIKDESFLIIETSPANFQVWVAIDAPLETRDDVRQQLIAALGADTGANGAVRLAGSLNVKAEHRHKFTGDYHRVKLVEVVPGALTTIEALQEKGLLKMPPCDSHGFASAVVNPGGYQRRTDDFSQRDSKRWPDYGRVLDGARLKKNGEADVSRADFCWAVMALDWGWTESETAAKLAQLSSKARSRHDDYAGRTVRNAALRMRFHRR